jgi:hypothetical protein
MSQTTPIKNTILKYATGTPSPHKPYTVFFEEQKQPVYLVIFTEPHRVAEVMMQDKLQDTFEFYGFTCKGDKVLITGLGVKASEILSDYM